MSELPLDRVSRRAFLQTSAALTAGLIVPGSAYAAGSDTLRVGLIGCGGRGTRGIIQNMLCAPGIEMIAMGDLVPDRLERARREIEQEVARTPALAAGYKVKDDLCFTGFDAYQKVLQTDVDLVMLATPPGFRPLHLEAAVNAGKHVFAEKPVATDIAGARSCLATYEKAVHKKLGIGVGTQRRHHTGYLEVMKRVQDGAIGEVLNGQVYWNQGGLWNHERKTEYTDTEWQIRNWLYFAWLSGDHIVEQHVHNIDVANWVMGGPPLRAVGVGGRQSRVQPEYGHIYDHFAVDFEYPNGVHITSMCRQINGARGRNGEFFQGTRGKMHTSESGPYAITGTASFEWQRPESWTTAMVQEHTDLVNSIRAGQPINDLKRITESVLTAIMGREAAYTGGILEWDALMQANQDIMPAPLAQLAYGALQVPPVPVPGRTRLERAFIDGW
jgi:predicted dehydrogenase